MKIRLTLFVVGAFTASVALGQIYKTVDANGNVVFTDIAPVDRSGQPTAKEVTVSPMNSYDPPPIQASSAPAAPEPSAASGYYSQLEVISPAPDEAIRDNAGNLRIEAVTTPPLRPDHRMLLVLDGNPTEVEAVDGVFELSNVDRGTHTAAAQIVDRQGNVLIQSDPVTFSLLRVSIGNEGGGPVPTPH